MTSLLCEQLMNFSTTDISVFYPMLRRLSVRDFKVRFANSLIKSDFFEHKDEIMEELKRRGFHIIFHGTCDMTPIAPAFYSEFDGEHAYDQDPEHRQDQFFLGPTLEIMSAGPSEALFLGNESANDQMTCRQLLRDIIGPTKPREGTPPDPSKGIEGTLRWIWYNRYYNDNYQMFDQLRATNAIHGPRTVEEAIRESYMVFGHMYTTALLQKYGCAAKGIIPNKINVNGTIKD